MSGADGLLPDNSGTCECGTLCESDDKPDDSRTHSELCIIFGQNDVHYTKVYFRPYEI